MNDPAATAASRRRSSAQRTRRALPGQLFSSTQIPVCFGFLAKCNAVEFENNARLFGGETGLSLVA